MVEEVLHAVFLVANASEVSGSSDGRGDGHTVASTASSSMVLPLRLSNSSLGNDVDEDIVGCQDITKADG